MDSTSLYVDFNELIEENLVLLSKEDTKKDFGGNEVFLFEGKEIKIYMDDLDEFGNIDNLIASGLVELNNTGLFSICKWSCRIDQNGIRHESEVNIPKR
jgi:hypothetical protein